MNINVDLEAVKQYNTALKQYRDGAAQLKAEIDFINNEIDSLCSELTAELGTQVTRDNIEQIATDICNKINSNLQSGNVVLAKIANETSNNTQQPQATVNAAATPMPQMTPSMPANVAAQANVQGAVGMPNVVSSVSLDSFGNNGMLGGNGVLPPFPGSGI